MSEIAKCTQWALVHCKQAVSECLKASLSDTQRTATAFLAPKKFRHKFLREQEICYANFSVHGQKLRSHLNVEFLTLPKKEAS